MSDKFFLDTNILVYSFDLSAPAKMKCAKQLIGDALQSGSGIISFQVVQEFINFATKQSNHASHLQKIHNYFLKVLQPLCSVQSSNVLYLNALGIREKTKFSWYDSLILASANAGGCSIVYTEDLKHKYVLDGLTVENPFL